MTLEIIRAVALMGFRELVTDLGGDWRALYEEAGIDDAETSNPQGFIPVRKLHELSNLAAARLGRPDFGLQWGARSDPSRLGPFHLALLNAQSGRDAIEIMIRFLSVNFPTATLGLKPIPNGAGELFYMRSLLRNPPPLVQFHERRVASLHIIMKSIFGGDYRPKQVWFSHRRQSPFDAYERVFAARPHFGASGNGIILDTALLDRPRASSNAQMRDMAVSFLKARAPARAGAVATETYHVVKTLFSGSECTIAAAAASLSVHPRTLQRQLKEEGTSFETIKDEVRRDLARELLAERELPITQIALDLHYANSSAFTRSCKRWFGLAPSALRQELANAPDEKAERASGGR